MIICPQALAHAKDKLRKFFNQFDDVEVAADVLGKLQRAPALFIIPLTSKGHGRPVDGGIRFPRAEETFGACIVMKSSGREKLLDLDAAVHKAFGGLKLPVCERPIMWQRSSLKSAAAGFIAWQITFETLVTTGDRL